MKNLNKLTKSGLTALLMLAFVLSCNAFAQPYEEYEQLFLSEEYTTDNAYHMDVSVDDASINVASDSLCYFDADDFDRNNLADDMTRLNAGQKNATMAPSYGLNQQYTDYVVKPLSETDVTVDKASNKNKPLFDVYDHTGPNAGSTYFAPDIAGKTAIGQFTYIRGDRYTSETQSAQQTNQIKLHMDEGAFSADDNKVTIEIEYYTETAGKYLVAYPTADGAQKDLELGTDAEPLTQNEWTVAVFNVTDADFTHYLKNELGTSLRINSRKDGNKIYYHSIRVYKTPSDNATVYKTATVDFAIEPVSTDTEISFDMLFPTEEAVNGMYNYNQGNSRVMFSIVDAEDNKVASVMWDTDTEDSEIYALYGDGEKELLYQGDIKNISLTYIIRINTTDKTYAVTVKDGDDELALAEGLEIQNIGLYSSKCNVMKMAIAHSELSQPVMTEFANVLIYAKTDENIRVCKQEASALQLSLTTVSSDFVLPVIGNIYPEAVSIGWYVPDGQQYLIVEGENALVYPDEDSHTLTLTAVITSGDYSVEKSFEITIKGMKGLFAEIDDVAETLNGNTVSASVKVKNAGTVKHYSDGNFIPFNITFVAVSQNDATGQITDRQTDAKTVNSLYETLEFEIHNLVKSDGDKVLYYLWDDNNMPVVNSAPTQVESLAVKNKAYSVLLSWNRSYDDNNALSHYAVYRDEVLIDICDSEPIDGVVTYSDVSEELSDKQSHTYTVVALDTNEFMSSVSKSVTGNATGMPYSFEVMGLTEADFDNNGIDIITGKTTVNEAYFELTTEGDVPCLFTPFPTGSTRKYFTPTFKTDKAKVSSADKEVVAEVTYLDKGVGTMHCIYWSQEGRRVSGDTVKLENTNQWKVAVFYMNDAHFEESTSFSAGDFGFYSTNTSLYIKKVELAKTEDYK